GFGAGGPGLAGGRLLVFRPCSARTTAGSGRSEPSGALPPLPGSTRCWERGPDSVWPALSEVDQQALASETFMRPCAAL
ncbi:hypothetical protein P7K49_014515, partial [Saguinus oedipus]